MQMSYFRHFIGPKFTLGANFMQNNARLYVLSNIKVNFKLPTGPITLFKIMVGLPDLIQINSCFTSPAEIKLATVAKLTVPFLLIIIIHTQP